MVSKEQRRHELARAKIVRQQARREAEARRRKLTAIIAAAVAVLVVVGGIAYLALEGQDDTTVAGETPSPTATDEPEDEGDDAGRAGTCRYRAAGEPAKPVDRPPNGRPAELASASASITTDRGTIEVAFDPAAAPCTVQSFLHLAQADYFDATTCHRLTTGEGLQVLQCGDPTGRGSGGPGYSFADEVTDDMTYERGVVAMANSGPDTNGSQFFLVYGDSQLPPSYTVFGHITSGLDVLDAIAAEGVADGSDDGAPATPVTISDVSVVSEAAVVESESPVPTTSVPESSEPAQTSAETTTTGTSP